MGTPPVERPPRARPTSAREYQDQIRDRLIEFGLDVEMVKYDVFINYPRSVSLTRRARAI